MTNPNPPAGEIWGMAPERFEALMATLSPDALLTKRGQSLEDTWRVEMRNHVAVLPVRGTISRYGGFFFSFFGGTSTQQIAEDFTAAMDNPGVKAIVLHIDSPGGMVSGINELAEMIHRAGDKKKVIAYVGGLGASAAYWLASAADEIVVDATAQLGSIGVMLSGWRSNNKEHFEIISSQSPRKNADPNTKTGRVELQNRVDALADVMIAAIARYRDVSTDTVLTEYGRGGVLIGQAAVDAGVADRLGSLEALVAELGEQTNHNGGFSMKLTDELKALIEPNGAGAVKALEELGYVPKATLPAPPDTKNIRAEAHGAGVAQGRRDGEQTGREQALKAAGDILDLCILARVADLSFAKDRVMQGDVDKARENILNTQADQAAHAHIFAAVGAVGTGEINPLVADAKQRADREK